MKAYYFANPEYEDAIYNGYPICIDLAELERLAREWDITVDKLLSQMHEATLDEIEEYGVYDG